eukprot:3791615-Prymnesium_polylepis.1
MLRIPKIHCGKYIRSVEPMFRTPVTGPTRCVASERAYCDDGVARDDTTTSPVRNKARFGRDR